MATQESTLRGYKFFASGPTGQCIATKDYSIAVRNGSWDNTRTFDSFSRGEKLGGKPSTLVQHAQRSGGSSDG
jgi:hypothetical protein